MIPMHLNEANRSIIRRLLVGRSNRPLRVILSKFPARELAALMGGLNRSETDLFIEALIETEQIGEVFADLPESQLQDLLSTHNAEFIQKIVTSISTDQAAYVIEHLTEEQRLEVLRGLPATQSKIIRRFLDFKQDSVGRIMETEVFCVKQELSVQEALEAIRKASAEDYSFYYVYCTDEAGHLSGIVSLRQIATANPNRRLLEIMKKDMITVSPTASAEEVARVVTDYGFVAVPVVGDDKILIGVVTVDDVLEVVQDLADKAVYAQVGLQQNDRIFTSVKDKFKNRLPWMILNLALAGVASFVVSLFEHVMTELIVLATLKNIVAGLGGNTAVQSMTVITRGFATGDFNFLSYTKAAAKEIMTSLYLGLAGGLVAGIAVFAWKQDSLVAVVICLSMIVNSLVAGLAGSLIPIAFVKFKRDPAVGSGVLVTTLTDVIGFFSFLGIAQLGLSMIK